MVSDQAPATTYRRLKWLAVLAPIFFIGVLEYSRYALAPIEDSFGGHVLMAVVVLFGAVFFYGAVFTFIDHLQGRLERQNRELVALRSAGLDVVADLSLDTVLQRIVDQACQLIGTRYGALALVDRAGGIESFITSGIDHEAAKHIGAPPVGRGLLSVGLEEGQRLRLDNIQADERSVGFPAGHPRMRTLLAVPVICEGPFRGNLYLSEKFDDQGFNEEEEETLARFASQAAIAVDNAYLHAQVKALAVTEERLRIARELHDGQAQVLAYVNTKAQVVRELIQQQKLEKALDQLEQLAGAAREVYTDVREGISGLRAVVDAEHDFVDALRSHVERWQDGCGIPADLKVDGHIAFPADVELQILRVVQEALANVRKHSQASQAAVHIEVSERWLVAHIEDDGIGFDRERPAKDKRPRFGLATMRERCEAIGASLEIESRPEEGTTVTIRYPLPRPTNGL